MLDDWLLDEEVATSFWTEVINETGSTDAATRELARSLNALGDKPKTKPDVYRKRARGVWRLYVEGKTKKAA